MAALLSGSGSLLFTAADPGVGGGVVPLKFGNGRVDLRWGDEDEAIARSHFPDPWDSGLNGIERAAKFVINREVFRRHEGRFEAEGVTPLAVRIREEGFVKHGKIHAVENSTGSWQPFGVIGTSRIERIKAILTPASVAIVRYKREQADRGGGRNQEPRPGRRSGFRKEFLELAREPKSKRGQAPVKPEPHDTEAKEQAENSEPEYGITPHRGESFAGKFAPAKDNRHQDEHRTGATDRKRLKFAHESVDVRTGAEGKERNERGLMQERQRVASETSAENRARHPARSEEESFAPLAGEKEHGGDQDKKVPASMNPGGKGDQ